MGKRWWESKTAWFNILTALVAAANEAASLIDQIQPLGLDNDLVATVRAVLLLVNIFGNMALRLVTKEPIRLT